MLINNKVYNIIKWFIVYFLPALGTFYFTISSIWGFTCNEQVLGTLTSVTIFLSMILGISNSSYKKSGSGTDGVMLVDTSNPDKDVYLLQLNNEATNLAEKDIISFKVDKKAKIE
jgi:hypothetical protein